MESKPRSRAPGRLGCACSRSWRLTEQTPRAPCHLSISLLCVFRRTTVFSLKPACRRVSLKARESTTVASEPQFRAQGTSTLERQRSRGMRGGAWGPWQRRTAGSGRGWASKLCSHGARHRTHLEECPAHPAPGSWAASRAPRERLQAHGANRAETCRDGKRRRLAAVV